LSRPAETTRGVLDTSVIILMRRVRHPDLLPTESYITAVTLAELSVGPLTAVDDRERATRQARLQQVEAEFDALPFDAAAARAFGRVAASLRDAGRKPTSRGFDALIAAVALAHGLPVYTANPSDFEGIDALTVVSVEVER